MAAAVVLVPGVGLALTITAVALLSRQLLVNSLHEDVTLEQIYPLLAAVVGFLVVCCSVVAIQGLRLTHRVAGPAYRIRTSLERIRAGDVAFRLTLRRGDCLRDVAEEVNRLLDWLNENPPQGVRTGGDLVTVDRVHSNSMDELDLEALIAASQDSDDAS